MASHEEAATEETASIGPITLLVRVIQQPFSAKRRSAATSPAVLHVQRRFPDCCCSTLPPKFTAP